MKLAIALLAAASLCSCNTTIGLGRDIKRGYQWSKRKIEENRAQGQQSQGYDTGGGYGTDTGYYDNSGAPVY